MSAAARPPASRRPPLVVRDADAGAHFEQFFISAVASVLVTRAFLALTGYPQLGGRGLHVAHAIWGGMAMAAALLLVLVSLSRRARSLAAVVGGAGFGLFVDELGKFLTRDNDYFFRPTIALIYVLFVALFLFVRARLSGRALDPEERLANAAAWLGEQAIGDLDPLEQRKALAHLDALDPADPRVVALRAVLSHPGTAPLPAPTPYGRMRQGFGRLATSMAAHPATSRALSAVLLAEALAWVLWTALGVHRWWSHRHALPGTYVDPVHVGLASIGAGAVSGGYAIAGAVGFLRARAHAYRNFRRALHVWLLFTQVFVFYDSQFAGLAILALNLVLLAAVNAVLGLERGRPAPDVTASRPKSLT